MDKLLMCDWAGMSPLEVALCQNAFQTSDPARWCRLPPKCQDENQPFPPVKTQQPLQRKCQITGDGPVRGLLLHRYPLGDAGLQLVYDVIGVLTTVHRWAFSTRGWHLRLQAPAGPAPAVGFDYGADLPGGPA
jgi:hypothetical protein